MKKHRIYTTSFASVYPHYVQKGREEATHEGGGGCGVRVQEVEDPLMRSIRCLDKLVDELAKGTTRCTILERSR